jgi:alkylation response protein AidB-like acyl-CoA dehydrogenase
MGPQSARDEPDAGGRMNPIDAADPVLLAREVSKAALQPHAAEVDEADVFPRESLAAVRDSGLLRLGVPSEYGGQPVSLLELCRVLEELGAGCASTALALAMHWISVFYLDTWFVEPADPAERDQLAALRTRVFGDIVRRGATVASCYGEPGSGASIFLPFSRAEPTDAGWVLTGRKLGTLAEVADYLAVHAVVGTGQAAGQVVQFVMPADLPGVRITRMGGFVGVRGAAPNRVEFDDCPVPAEFRFGPLDCFAATNMAFPYATLLLASPYVGLAVSAVATARDHLSARTVQGAARSLAYHPDSQRTMAELVIDLESARSLLYRAAAEAVPHPGPDVRMLNECAKVAVAAMVTRVTVGALQACGARALSAATPLQRFVRDSLACALHPPTSPESLALIGRLTFGLAAPETQAEELVEVRRRGGAEPGGWWPATRDEAHVTEGSADG